MSLKTVCRACVAGLLSWSVPASAQSATDEQAHEHPAAPEPAWHLMQDGVIYGLFNHQGGPRGGREFVVPNWWMGMWMRANGPHQFGISAMVSLDPATVGDNGYGEIFQVGEVFEGKPLIDRQHPHDFLMQLSASWRRSVGSAEIVIAGGIVGEPTLGPVAFMHRSSAAGLPLAPLGHHTFDSTHISFGVVTAAIERGRWTIEGSVFNGREPDERRWNVEFAPLDSVAGRLWYKPSPEWAFQVSSGRLEEPEELVPGDAVRTTASGSWFRQREQDLRAVTVGYGVNSAHGERRHGVFGEFTMERGSNAVSARLESQQVETDLLISGEIPHEHHESKAPATVVAFTAGAARRLVIWRGFEGAIGALATFYRTPSALRVTHGESPVSYQVFLRLRLPTGPMGRMWNMVMSQGPRMGGAGHPGHAVR